MITFRHVSYTYPDADQPALRDINLSLPEGTFALVAGHSGAGKSTLLRCLNGLVPHFSGGALEGSIEVDGRDPVQATPQIMSRHVGFVFQSPDAQFVLDHVEDEIAFALENRAMPRQDMRVRVEESLDLLNLAHLRGRALETLSGGERQRVAIAAALALRPRVLALDEPTSQLDPESAEDVLHALARLNSDLGLTILLVEHRLERVLAFADTLIYLLPNRPGVVAGPPRKVVKQIPLVPPLVAVGKARGWEPIPLTIKEGLRFARSEIKGKMQPPGSTLPHPAPRHARHAVPATSKGEPFLQARAVAASYNGRPVLRGVTLAVEQGEIVALMGRNGAGKTTLLKTLVGLVRPQHGQVRVAGHDIAGREVAHICRQVGYLPQNPDALLFADTVEEELHITLRNHDKQGTPGSLATLLARLGLAEKAGRYPRDLSAGERQRVALGAIAVTEPGALLLDEPTRGLDYAAKQELARLLHEWRGSGVAILLVTHDVELVAALANRVILMSQGDIIASGSPAEVMSASPFFAPQVARLFPGTGWLTPADIPATHLKGDSQ